MSELHWDTQITKIQPNEIRVRGYRLDELMGRINFGQAVYLILKGELPGENIGRMMEMIMVTSIDHGTTPPSTLAARTAASTGAPLNAALAAGILTINKHHGGAVEACMEMLLKGHELNLPPAEAAAKIISDAKAQKVRLSGFGHRLHTADPRTRQLLASAREFGVAGPYIALVEAVEAEFAKSGKPLPINVDGALAAILCELGFPTCLANLFFIMARVPGLAAHILEEQTKEKPMRKIHPSDCGYTGPEDRSL